MTLVVKLYSRTWNRKIKYNEIKHSSQQKLNRVTTISEALLARTSALSLHKVINRIRSEFSAVNSKEKFVLQVNKISFEGTCIV